MADLNQAQLAKVELQAVQTVRILDRPNGQSIEARVVWRGIEGFGCVVVVPLEDGSRFVDGGALSDVLEQATTDLLCKVEALQLD